MFKARFFSFTVCLWDTYFSIIFTVLNLRKSNIAVFWGDTSDSHPTNIETHRQKIFTVVILKGISSTGSDVGCLIFEYLNADKRWMVWGQRAWSVLAVLIRFPALLFQALEKDVATLTPIRRQRVEQIAVLYWLSHVRMVNVFTRKCASARECLLRWAYTKVKIRKTKREF